MDFNLERAGSLSGTVTLVNGGAAGYAFLVLETSADTISTQTDENGQFVFTNLPPGDYTVGTMGVNYMTVRTNAAVGAGADTSVDLNTAPIGVVTGTVTVSVLWT